MIALDITIAIMTPADWEAVAAIHQEGIDTGQATFKVAPAPSWDDWRNSKINECSLVARCAGEVIGWAALSPVSRRQCYAGVAENSVYVAAKARGKGVGLALMSALIAASEAHGIWMLQTSIFPENVASLRLHERCGFRIVGRRERIALMQIGQMEGQWRDTLLLERRSGAVGV